MKHALILFDLDGTLVDSLPDIAAALNHALGRAGLAPLGTDLVRTLVGEGVVRLAEKALAHQGAGALDPAALASDVVAYYEEHPCDLTRPFPGVEPTLDELARRGQRLAVLTNKPGGVARALLEALGLAGRFAAIVGDGDGHPRKPDPAAARALLARFAVTPAQALMVGDGLPDLALARAAGLPAAAALWGYTDRARLVAERPDHLLERPAELLDL